MQEYTCLVNNGKGGSSLNLNNFGVYSDGNYDADIKDNSVCSGEVNAYFRGIEEKLICHIEDAEFVFGAVAWLTSSKILDALAKVKYGVQVVVQKEDFLRPDIETHDSEWRKYLRSKYSNLKCDVQRYCFDNIMQNLSICGDPSIEPVMCVGNHNRDKSPAFPRMHNKFLLFARYPTSENIHDCPRIEPYAVWTGSFNFTKNATYSLENALYITNMEIVQAYFREYGQIYALSEFLDWESDWCAPAYRIGT